MIQSQNGCQFDFKNLAQFHINQYTILNFLFVTYWIMLIAIQNIYLDVNIVNLCLWQYEMIQNNW